MAMWDQEAPDNLGRFRRGPFEPETPSPKPRFRHDVPIRTATVSVDRKILIALDAQGFVNGWDAVTAKRLYRHPAVDPKEVPQRLTASPDGRFAVLSPRSLPSGLVRVLDLRTGIELRRFDRGFSPSFSPGGELLACSDGKQLRRWAVKNGAELPRFSEAEESLKWTAWSPTGDVIAASGEDSPFVAVWDATGGRRMIRDLVGADHEAAVSLAFSPDGKTLAIGSHWGIRFCSLAGPQERRRHSHEEYALGRLKFSADGLRMIAMCRQRRLLVWETFTGRPLFTWASYLVEDGSLEVSEGGDVALWIERGGIRLERIPQFLAGDEDGHVVRSVCFTPEGQVITGDHAGAMRVWDPQTQKELRRFAVPRQPVRSFSRDGKWAVFGGAGDPVGIWDLVAGREVLKLDPTPGVRSVALSPDSLRMALGHVDGTVSLWSVAEKKELQRIRSEMSSVTAVSWSGDGKSLAWGDDSGVVAIAEGSRGAEPLWFRTRGGAAIRDLNFSPDGKALVATDATGSHRRYSDPGIEPTVVLSLPQHYSAVGSLPDERWVASGFQQKRGMLGIVIEVPSPDGSHVACVTSSGRLLIWQAPGGK